MHPDFSPFEPAPSPADRDMSTLKDVLSGCAIIAFVCAVVVWLPVLAGGR